uniref:Uncharacterized protein n=1 Tax=Cannabis sativa TaxID=3483 RepID=A0A803QCS1_CANSA
MAKPMIPDLSVKEGSIVVILCTVERSRWGKGSSIELCGVDFGFGQIQVIQALLKMASKKSLARNLVLDQTYLRSCVQFSFPDFEAYTALLVESEHQLLHSKRIGKILHLQDVLVDAHGSFLSVLNGKTELKLSSLRLSGKKASKDRPNINNGFTVEKVVELCQEGCCRVHGHELKEGSKITNRSSYDDPDEYLEEEDCLECEIVVRLPEVRPELLVEVVEQGGGVVRIDHRPWPTRVPKQREGRPGFHDPAKGWPRDPKPRHGPTRL